MKLNPDCIRDILFIIEEQTTYSTSVDSHSLCSQLEEKYSSEEILYHCRQCEYNGLFTDVNHYFNGFIIQDLSPYGHQFINDVRQENNWKKTKDIAKQVGSTSLDVVKEISSQVISNLISNQFGK